MNRDIGYCECGEALDYTVGTCPVCDDWGDDEDCTICGDPLTIDGHCDNLECGKDDDDENEDEDGNH